MASRTVVLSVATSCLTIALGAACGTTDFSRAAPGDADGGGGGNGDGGSGDALVSADGSRCAPNQKVCGGACVGQNDPAFGCGLVQCGAPCAFANAAARCNTEDHVCEIATCNAGFANCNNRATDGCEEGRFGGACQLTTPVPMADGTCLALDANYVYFSTSTQGSVLRAARRGGAPTIVASSEVHPTALVVDPTYVFFVNTDATSGSVVRANLDGSAKLTLAQGLRSPKHLVVDATYVYYSTEDGADCRIRRVDRNGAGDTELTSDTLGTAVRGMAQDATSLYVALDGKVVALSKASATTGPYNPLVPNQNLAQGIRFVTNGGSASLYWLVGTGEIFSKLLPNGVPALAFPAGFSDFTVLGNDAWLVTRGAGPNLGTIQHASTSSKVVDAARATGQNFPHCVAADKDGVYWLVDGNPSSPMWLP